MASNDTKVPRTGRSVGEGAAPVTRVEVTSNVNEQKVTVEATVQNTRDIDTTSPRSLTLSGANRLHPGAFHIRFPDSVGLGFGRGDFRAHVKLIPFEPVTR